jgi:N-acyl-D-aspartate/D-glutamate deacylase
MSYDVVIEGGTVIDGSGGPRRSGDIAIKDGRIVQIAEPGTLTGDAARRIDATNRVVCPGFVDVHTHYDAQVFWDSTLGPSPLHGVTTAIGGNCGFTIAPLSGRPEDADYLMRMLARVEGMPLASLRDGVPWNWNSFAEYLDSIEGRLSINAGFKVGHSAIRRTVMGEEATRREATSEELAQQMDLLRTSLEAGGIGFSSSWARTHNDAAGDMVPSRYANRDELVAMAGVCSEFPGTSLEFIPCIGEFEDWAIDLMADMSAAAQRQLNWNVMITNAKNIDGCYAKLRAGDVASERGGKVVALTLPMNLGVRLSFEGGFVLDALPGWEEAMFAPHDEKLALLADPAARRQLDELAQQDGPLRNMANWKTKVIFDTVAPENAEFQGRVVADIAEEQDKDPFDALCDIVVADDLHTSFGNPAPIESAADWEARIGLWRDGRAVIGASDAGAHLDLLASFNYGTYVLGNAARGGYIGFEEAISLMTDVPARLYGLTERGRIEEGWHADLVVFDPDAIGSEDLQMRYDMAHGAGRLWADAIGIDNVICGGVSVVEHGSFTDERPGTVLRSGRDTSTPQI